jgi:hypothetical protein
MMNDLVLLLVLDYEEPGFIGIESDRLPCEVLWHKCQT